jgi:hypothetical protein
MTITASRLERLNACQSQVDAFRAIWGEGPAPMTVEAAMEHAATFDWDWAAHHFLSPAALVDYARAEAAARNDYCRAVAAAWADYWRVAVLARDDYDRARARAFAECYIKQETGQ